MQKVAKCFLHFLNHCNLDKPSVRCRVINQDEAVLYKINYSRLLLKFYKVTCFRFFFFLLLFKNVIPILFIYYYQMVSFLSYANVLWFIAPL